MRTFITAVLFGSVLAVGEPNYAFLSVTVGVLVIVYGVASSRARKAGR